jgi:hypothetical protein
LSHFEKRGGRQGGVYFKEFDLDSQGFARPDTILETAVHIVPRADYDDLDLEEIYLYSNEDGAI